MAVDKGWLLIAPIMLALALCVDLLVHSFPPPSAGNPPYNMTRQEELALLRRILHKAHKDLSSEPHSVATPAETHSTPPTVEADTDTTNVTSHFIEIDTLDEVHKQMMVRKLGDTQARAVQWNKEWDALLSRRAARSVPYVATISIIVPVYNMETSITSALESIEASIASFGQRLQSSKAWQEHRVPVLCEVMVLDDASTDNTRAMVKEFVDPKYMPSLPAPVRLTYTLLRASQNGGQAAGRNACARRAQGEILYFLDADDVFLAPHIAAGYTALSSNETVLAWAKTGLAVESKHGEVLPEWSEAIHNTAPTNLIIWRSIYIFSEGYSAHELFRRDHEDVMYTHAIEYVRQMLPVGPPSSALNPAKARRLGYAEIDKVTVEYRRRPGNHLDRQIISGKFSHPMSDQHQYDEWHRAGPERANQVAAAMSAQASYLQSKIDALLDYESTRNTIVLP